MLKNIRLPQSVSILGKCYLWGLLVFTLFRVILFANELVRLEDSTTYSDILRSFIMGFRFDTVILCYILILPFVLLTVGSFVIKIRKTLLLFSKYYVLVLFTITFFISAADIPYFNHFFSRLSITALEWMDSPKFVLGMIVQEPKYWLVTLPFLIILWFFYKKINKIFQTVETKISVLPMFLFTVVGLLLLVIGIRGRLAHKSPIRVGTAYFSQSPLLNQLGLNPSFTFLKSYLVSKKEENQPVQFMQDADAFKLTKEYLFIDPKSELSIAREVAADSTGAKAQNVVVILMESMSAAKMGRHGNTHNLTPFLDSLTQQGAYYENAYSSGIHTFNGIFSTLFSMPAIYRKHPMKGGSIKEYDGIYENLKAHDYSTVYYCTHDGQFDNVEGFLTANFCDEVVAQDDYPAEEVKSTLGVPDDYLFRYAIPHMTNLGKQDKSFAATLMTASDHGPYYIPDYFTPHSEDVKDQIVEYADWSLKQFFKQASKEDWYANTLFVLVADHGSAMNATYDMPLAFNHTPLLFYTPSGKVASCTSSNMAGQMDIFPTIMDYLNLSYTNNTLGINLNEHSRPYIYFNGDDKYGVIDDKWYLVSKKAGGDALYKYRSKDRTNYASEEPNQVKEMKRYAEAQLQTYQYISSH